MVSKVSLADTPPVSMMTVTVSFGYYNTHWWSFAIVSFAGLGFLSLYLAGKMHLFDRRGHTYKGFIFAAPWIGAMLVAISRTVDYRHHWQDVTVGAIIGSGLAFFAYRQYYPPLWSDTSAEPYAPRIDIDFAPA